MWTSQLEQVIRDTPRITQRSLAVNKVIGVKRDRDNMTVMKMELRIKVKSRIRIHRRRRRRSKDPIVLTAVNHTSLRIVGLWMLTQQTDLVI